MTKFWSKILNGKNSKISHKIYKILLFLHNNHIYSYKWIVPIEKILQDVGLNYIWLNNNIHNSDWLCNEIKKRLQCQYLHKWNTEIQTSSKSINYRIFKTNFVTEFYITHLQPKFYIPLARFRTTNNRLPVERGRWENVERAHRICTLCNCNAISDEFHFLFECEAFKERRKVFLLRFYLRHVNTLKFQMLMCTTNVTLLKRLSRCISERLSKF